MNVSKKVYLIGGYVATGLGILGAFLPLLPTTPFLLVALFCFSRSSEKMKTWLLNNKLLGRYIISYYNGEGMPMRAKVSTLLLMWVTISISLVALDKLWLRLLLVGISAGVTYHIVRIKTKKDE